MYTDINAYAVAVCEYITGEFTDWQQWFAHEKELAERFLVDEKPASFIRYCYSQRYVPPVAGECMVAGHSVAKEIASYTGSFTF